MNEVYVPFPGTKLSYELHIKQQVCWQTGEERVQLVLDDRADRHEGFTYRCVVAPAYIQKYSPLRTGQ
jgi:hypothetical protein